MDASSLVTTRAAFPVFKARGMEPADPPINPEQEADLEARLRQIDALAQRVGVEPVGPDEYPILTVYGGEGRGYDMIALLHASLDRVQPRDDFQR